MRGFVTSASLVVALALPAFAQGTAARGPAQGASAAPTARRTAVVTALAGSVEVEVTPGSAWRPVRLLERLPASARLRTGPGSMVELAFPDGGSAAVGPGTIFVLATGAITGTGPALAPPLAPAALPEGAPSLPVAPGASAVPAAVTPAAIAPGPGAVPVPAAPAGAAAPAFFAPPLPPPTDVLVPPGAAAGEQGGLDVLLQ